MSSIDHIYVSEDLESKTQTYKLDNSSSDHLPIMAKIVRNNDKSESLREINHYLLTYLNGWYSNGSDH